MSLVENLPCISCASNRWMCQWDLLYHECREASPNPEDGIIRAHMEVNCPQFLDPSPSVIPMNHETEVTFQGKNLDTGKLSHDTNETLPLHLYVKSFDKKIDSKLQVTLYNCSFGRSDCSLCLAADPAYRCVWCRGQNRCVYEALCSNVTSECPPPVITRIQPETGPLGGGIRVTIHGSNLGVTADDVKKITVAGQNCAFEPKWYSVSTRGGRSINVTGQGFSLIQKFAMVVIAEPLRSWRRRREAESLEPMTVTGTEYVFYNDTKVVFLSPAVPEEPEAYNLTALIQMDGHRALLRTEAGAFEYVADPTFENFTGGVKKQVNKLIHARVSRPTAWGPRTG
ncbi:Plexin-B2 [Cricetulus griseus]|uniref:Plexin-B2 n=1 Tax=Cricetulus griseus TaxID=10029 RepID=G3IP74_CRIGR|nr:Plexin-B2 [Cricetulus griseus]